MYRQRAQAGWAWFQSTGMINSSNLVNDGVNLNTCRNNGDVTWTYNQGVLMNALVQLNRLTGDANALATARRIGDAMTTSTYLSPNGILREPNESNTCSGDGVSFKGAGDPRARRAERGHRRRVQRVPAAAGGQQPTPTTGTALDAYGSHWAGPYVATNHSCQHSVLDLLNVA